jgi:hypothetical protein
MELDADLNQATHVDTSKPESPNHKNEWSSQIETLLKTWRTQVAEKIYFHNDQAKKYNLLNYFIGVPPAVVSGLTGVGILATFSTSCDTNLKWLQLGIGILISISGAMSAVHVGFGFKGTSKSHKKIALSYATLYRTIDVLLNIPVQSRGSPQKVLKDISEHFDNIAKSSKGLTREKMHIHKDDKNVHMNGLSLDQCSFINDPPTEAQINSMPRMEALITATTTAYDNSDPIRDAIRMEMERFSSNV